MSSLPIESARLSLILGKSSVYTRNGITLKDYQEHGVSWMIRQEANGHGGLLADEPGLGKTFQSLALPVSHPQSVNLVVVPSSTLAQWERDALLLCGAVYVHHGNRRQDTLPSGVRVVLTTPQTLMVSGHFYEKYNSSCVDLHAIHWDRIIVDEIHCIKNPRSKASKCFMKLRGTYKWGLSGTPIQNTKSEIKNLFRFVTDTPEGSVLETKLEDLLDPQTGRILRRKKVDKLPDLPHQDIENYGVDFATPEEREFYLKVKRNVRDEFLMAQGGSVQEEMAVMMELLLRMRQMSSHPQLVINGYRRKLEKNGVSRVDARQIFPDWTHGISSKHQALLDLISQHPGDNSIVFSQFTEEMNILEKLFRDQGYTIGRIDGSLSQTQKAEVIRSCEGTTNHVPEVVSEKLPKNLVGMVDSFVNRRPQILLIQIRAGGVGLNLQSYNRVYISSPDWNPANEDQAMARAWRLGQEKTVYVKRIILNDIDEKTSVIDTRILSIQETKRKLQSELLHDKSLSYNGKRSVGRGLSRRDLTRLLR